MEKVHRSAYNGRRKVISLRWSRAFVREMKRGVFATDWGLLLFIYLLTPELKDQVVSSSSAQIFRSQI
jgi:hypothetical protein